MKYSNISLPLIAAFFFVSVSQLSAQENQFTANEIIGTWILKSALFNGNIVPLEKMENRMTFEFSAKGAVTFTSFTGEKETGEFLIEDNKIIDPVTPEHPAAKILKLTTNLLILSMEEEDNKMILTFELTMPE